MPKLIQISPVPQTMHDPSYGTLVMFGLAADGSVWKLYNSARGDIWVPVRAVTYTSVAALKQTASGDR